MAFDYPRAAKIATAAGLFNLRQFTHTHSFCFARFDCSVLEPEDPRVRRGLLPAEKKGSRLQWARKIAEIAFSDLAGNQFNKHLSNLSPDRQFEAGEVFKFCARIRQFFRDF